MSQELWGSGYVCKRGRIWYYNYSVNGIAFHRSAHTKKRSEAVKLLKLAVGEGASGKLVLTPVAERVTLGEMMRALAADYEEQENRPTIAAASNYLLSYFGEQARALSLRKEGVLKAYRDHRKTMLIKRATGNKIIVDRKTVDERILQPPSNGTINYELAILRRAFNLMVEAKKLSKDHVPKMPMFKKKTLKIRQGFLEPADFERLRTELPEHLRDPIQFLYLSGWRKNEMMTLEWRDVDLPARMIQLRAEQSKNDEPRSLPLTDELLAIIERADEARSNLCPFVFQRDGAKLPSFRKAWASACERAGFRGRLVHDLRRSAVRNFVNSGMPDSVAMRITGHKTRAMFDRYNIRDESDVQAGLAAMQKWVSAQAKLRPKVSALPQRKSA